MTSRDGTGRYWRGDEAASAHDNLRPGGWPAFRRMAPAARAAALDYETARIVALAFEDEAAQVRIAGSTGDALLTLERPAFGTGFLKDQMPHLRSYADLRADRLAEIQVQQTDLLSFFGALVHLDAEAHQRTLELLAALLRMAAPLVMRLKMHFDLPRPIAVTPMLQPVIQTPGYSAWPSGHATEAFAIAYLLRTLHALGRTAPSSPHRRGGPAAPPLRIEDELGDAAAHRAPSLPLSLAARIAANRTVAGLHYPCDSAAGAVLGLSLAEMLVAYLRAGEGLAEGEAVPEAPVPARAFRAKDFTGDFELEGLRALVPARGEARLPSRPRSFLDVLWEWAKREWARP